MNSNINSSSNYIITSDYNSELKNNSYINNYKEEEEEGEEKNYCCWSHEEEQIFQNALAEMDPNSPTFYQDLASRIPWKYIHEIKQHYRELTGETDSSGHVPDDDDEEKKPIIIQRIISPPPQEIINENVVVSTPDRSTKNVPWTEEEHQLFLMGLEIYGKGKWKFISKFFVQTRTPVQVASHAQKFFAHHRKLDNNNCSKPPPPRVNKVRRHSIFDNTDPYFLPDSQEPYSYPPPPLLPPPAVVVQNHHHHPPPNDHEQTGFLDSIISFPGIGNITDDDQSATALSGNHQLFYNPNTITATDSFLQTQNVEPITGGGEEEVFFAQTDDDHQYYNPSSSSSAGSSNGNYNYQGGI